MKARKVVIVFMAMVIVMACGVQRVALAGYVHHEAESGVIATWLDDENQVLKLLTSEGQIWRFWQQTETWELWNEDFQVVPLADLEWFDGAFFITKDSEFWYVLPDATAWVQGSLPFLATAVPDLSDSPPTSTVLQNYPNPFNPSTTISVKAEEFLGDAHIQIFDARGLHVRTIRIGDLQPVEISVTWDGKSDRGDDLPSGVYFYQLAHAGGESAAKKAIMLK